MNKTGKNKPINWNELEESVAPDSPDLSVTTTIDANYNGFKETASGFAPNKFANNDGEKVIVKWTNRRRMAWTALISMIVVMAAIFLLPSIANLPDITEIVKMFFITMTSIVAAYMGFTTLPYLNGTTRKKVKFEQDDY